MKIEIDSYHAVYETNTHKIRIDDEVYLGQITDLEPYLTTKQYIRLVTSDNALGIYNIKPEKTNKLKEILTPYKY